MKNQPVWLHGTSTYFEQWALPTCAQPYNRGFESHSAIFFTTDKNYAMKAACNSDGLCTANLIDSARLLNMNDCAPELAERYRLRVLQKSIGSKNPNVLTSHQWRQAWVNGSIMKYAATSPPLTAEEHEQLKQMARLAVYEKHTLKGRVAFKTLQQLTRTVIEELITSARELGYDAVIGNEIDTDNPTQPMVYPIMFVLNPNMLTTPLWLTKPTT